MHSTHADLLRHPTPIAQVVQRLKVVGLDHSADTFLHISYLAEAALKLLASTLVSGLRASSEDEAYPFEYELLHADSLGPWNDTVRAIASYPLAQNLPSEFRPLTVWLTKKSPRLSDRLLDRAVESCEQVLEKLGSDFSIGANKRSALDVLTMLVVIRSKTKAHGAQGISFFEESNGLYHSAVTWLVEQCPAFSWAWLYARPLSTSGPKQIVLEGLAPHALGVSDPRLAAAPPPGVCVLPTPTTARRAFACGALIHTTPECQSFLLPNGGVRRDGDFEFIDYHSGQFVRRRLPTHVLPPAQLPPSETAAGGQLDVQSNVFGNLPPLPPQYVERPRLERELDLKLKDRNHHIITLHGRGGAGKTHLSLRVAHQLAAAAQPHYDRILWFSARDMDLKPTGPKKVAPDVLSLDGIVRAYCRLMGVPTSRDALSEALQRASDEWSRGTLFIFDNFEALDHATAIHQFLDTHTHIPNKVLITSRERAFKADWPIEVSGMERREAFVLMTNASRELQIEGLVTEKVREDLFEYAEGHAYVMRVLVGEIAKQGHYVPPRQLVPKRLDIVDAVFERSFEKLTFAGRWVFLTVGNWRSYVPELALIVALGRRPLDVEAGLDECVRLSLLTSDMLAGGDPCYYAPQLARVFAKKKLEGDPDKLGILEDIEMLQHFGVLVPDAVHRTAQLDVIQKYIRWAELEAQGSGAARRKHLGECLEAIARMWPTAWLDAARFWEVYSPNLGRMMEALRRAVEAMPSNKDAWLARADHAHRLGDDSVWLASLIGAVDAEPNNTMLLSAVAAKLAEYLTQNKDTVPRERRGLYLTTVRNRMEAQAELLDSTGLSRLAWLFLLENRPAEARSFAERGLLLDVGNPHCKRILERIAAGTRSL